MVLASNLLEFHQFHWFLLKLTSDILVQILINFESINRIFWKFRWCKLQCHVCFWQNTCYTSAASFFCIQFKVLVFTFKALHGIGPGYLRDHLPWFHLFFPPEPTMWACYWLNHLGSYIWQVLSMGHLWCACIVDSSHPWGDDGFISSELPKIPQDLVIPAGVRNPGDGKLVMWLHYY